MHVCMWTTVLAVSLDGVVSLYCIAYVVCVLYVCMSPVCQCRYGYCVMQETRCLCRYGIVFVLTARSFLPLMHTQNTR